MISQHRRSSLVQFSILALIFILAAGAGPDSKPAYAPSSHYETREIEGWSVTIHKDLLADSPLATATLDLLRLQLVQIERMVPAQAVAKLRKIRIWVEKNEPHHPCMAYHPDAGWLKSHDMNPEKAGCVELANARNFLDWTKQQPWMVLHELAHGYHHQFLPDGYSNATLAKLFNRATDSDKYNSVLHINGRTERAYALNNPMEFFAEASEAFFGTNDFYPFVRAELQKHDPETFAILKTVWESN